MNFLFLVPCILSENLDIYRGLIKIALVYITRISLTYLIGLENLSVANSNLCCTICHLRKASYFSDDTLPDTTVLWLSRTSFRSNCFTLSALLIVSKCLPFLLQQFFLTFLPSLVHPSLCFLLKARRSNWTCKKLKHV